MSFSISSLLGVSIFDFMGYGVVFRVTDETISTSLSVAPNQEATLFSNRDKFDLVAICDESSNTIQHSEAVANLMKAIYELSFKTILRNKPMILEGGLNAWKKDLGDVELVRDGHPTINAAQTNGGDPASSTMNAYYEGLGINGSPSINGPSTPLILNGTAGGITPTSTVTIPMSAPAVTMGRAPNGHSRVPAESSSSSTSAFSPSIHESYLLGRGSASARPGGGFGDSSSVGLGMGVGVGGVSSPPVTYQQWIPPAGASRDSLPLTSPR